MSTTDNRRQSLYVEHLRHRYYADGGNAGRVPSAGLALHRAGGTFGARTWATYCDAHRRAESIRAAARATGCAPFPTAPRPAGVTA